jgi:hypothetical protein
MNELVKQLSGLQCNSVNPKLRSRARHLGQSRRVGACWDIGPLDIFAIYTEAARVLARLGEVVRLIIRKRPPVLQEQAHPLRQEA